MDNVWAVKLKAASDTLLRVRSSQVSGLEGFVTVNRLIAFSGFFKGTDCCHLRASYSLFIPLQLP